MFPKKKLKIDFKKYLKIFQNGCCSAKINIILRVNKF